MGTQMSQINEILGMIKEHRITSVEGLKRIKEIRSGQAVMIPDPGEEDRAIRDREIVGAGEWPGIAVIGISGQFPGSKDINEFRENLESGKDLVTAMPTDRWEMEEFLNLGLPGMNKDYFQRGGFLSGTAGFDPLFFNISPREALLMDPQQRLFLQEAWKALEDAGYSAGALSERKCGVFVGCTSGDYNSRFSHNEMADVYSFPGNTASILAARISYFLNLRGPSLSIDTACSSSLVATHLACESIRGGTCEMAIAGGVTLMSTPFPFLNFSKAGMLSPVGRCKTFDNDADGFVPGEGVGVLILKPLAAARQDGDHIYGIIKGTAINQDGKTNGITAPSAPSQTALECEVYDTYRIHPETIGYIEAHGTGTKLGDPIEIQALTNAFRKYTREKHFCAVGSVKTNIGHTLAAAGAAGLIKVLLALKHKRIPPSLHFQKPNEHINFQESPFYVNTRLQEWQARGNTPRRAAVSSFGFSGTNCHMVVEEAPVRDSKLPGNGFPYYLLPLSAKTAAALGNKAGDLANWVKREGAVHSLSDIAYTLHLGRTHFPVRAVLVVKDIHDLGKKIEAVRDKGQARDYFTSGTPDKSSPPTPVFKQLGSGLIRELRQPGALRDGEYKEKLSALADLYIQGYDLEWNALYKHMTCRRISLPTYPFDLETYWITKKENSGTGHSRLHPLVGRNISTLHQEKFITCFSGDEFYLSHHIIAGRKILPGVAFIEMVRAAGEIAGEKPVRKLKNITWLRPIVVAEKGEEIYIHLYPGPAAETVDFEVISTGETNQTLVHARGQLLYETPADEGAHHEPVNIDEIKQRCTRQMEGKTCYAWYRQKGLHLGSSFRVIQELFASREEVLARLQLPRELEQGYDEFKLHPALMDGALQSSIGLIKDEVENFPLSIPFAMGEVEILGPLSKICFSHFTRSGPEEAEADREGMKFAIRLMDETGKVLLKVKDFLARPFQAPPQTAVKDSRTGETTRMYFRGTWEKKDPGPGTKKLPGHIIIFDDTRAVFDAVKNWRENEESHDEKGKTGIFLVKPGEHFHYRGDSIYEINPVQMEDYRQLLKGLQLQGRDYIGIIHNWSPANPPDTGSDQAGIKAQLDKGIYSLFYLCQALMNRDLGLQTKIGIIYTYPGHEHGPEPLYAGVGGFAKTISREDSRFTFRTVEIRNASTRQDTNAFPAAGIILAELQAGTDENNTGREIEVSYRDGQRWQKAWKNFEIPKEAGKDRLLKKKGVYLLTGGMGALGMIFARYLAKEVEAKLVLTDRTPLEPGGKARLRELESLGASVLFHQADISRYEEVKNLIKKAREHYKSIDGILHCAGVARDGLLRHKTREEAEQVLAPKVYGTIYLDEAAREENLDFFILFSSAAAVLGNTGQCDYAYANNFMDYFAEKREQRRREHKRRGKTVSINWPLWREGGLKPGQANLESALESIGVELLETGAGLQAFAEILTAHEHQVMMLPGEAQKIKQIGELTGDTPAQPSRDAAGPALEPPGKVNQDQLYGKLHQDLVKLAAEISKVKENRLSDTKNLAEYGFDSISFVEFNQAINKKFSLALTPALFFEYPTLSKLSSYLYNAHRESFARYYRENTGPTAEPVAAGRHEDIPAGEKIRRRFKEWNTPGEPPAPPDLFSRTGGEPIAIIGMSGVMPQSENLEIFWENLEAGNDLITKISPQRWKLGGYNEALSHDHEMSELTWGGYMKEVDKFDARFFGISPREAGLMDPQQRIFLEIAWKTIEDAGYRVSDLSGTRTGLFVGASTGDYSDIVKANETGVEPHAITGLSHCILANRVSYLLNLHGPSEAIDTACSSSLTALHHAVESIRGGSCDLAIVGGVNVLLTPVVTMGFTKAGMLSPDGRCKTFDKSANGYVRGEGAGAVLLKPLGRAARDGDHIYAVIKASTANHGGHASSLTAPNPAAQADLLIEAYEKAGVDPSTVTYIEAHGTGTSLGDPVEINGLKRAFTELYKRKGQTPPQNSSCGIGAVKTNIGHLEAAAGIAGLIKTLLAMKNKQLPATVHFKELNPYIQLQDSPFYIVRDTVPWEQLYHRDNEPVPRRAGVSSFGFGGANAHVVLEEYQDRYVSPGLSPGEPRLIVLSARDEERLKQYARDLASFLDRHSCSPPPPAPTSSDLSSPLQSPGQNPLEETREEILKTIARMLEVKEDTIDMYEDISEYGVDPVKISVLANRMVERYKIEITNDILTTHPSVDRLAQYVLAHRPGPGDAGEKQRSLDRALTSRSAGLNLADTAYTLQVGRDAMEERLALIVTTIPALKEKLNLFCQAREDKEAGAAGLFRGSAGADQTLLRSMLDGHEGREFLNIIIREKKIEKLASLWVKGVEIPWQMLYQGELPRRISLPTYPFARERHWLDSEKPTGEKPTGEKSTGKPGMELSAPQPSPAPIPGEEENSLRDMISSAPPRQRKELVESFLSESITRMLRLSPTRPLDVKQPLVNLGLDSLMALQLKKQIEVTLGQDVSMVKFIGGESVADLAGQLLGNWFPGENNPPAAAAETVEKETAADNYLQNDLIEGVL